MRLLNQKNPKDMTDDELLAEFRQAQRAAKTRGQHLPLTVTRADPVNPTIHRPTIEDEIEIFRKKSTQQRLAQNTAADVVKGIGRANSIHGGFKSLLDGIGAGLSIGRMTEQRRIENARAQGRLGGGSLEDFQKIHGNAPELEKAFMEGLQEYNQRRKNKR